MKTKIQFSPDLLKIDDIENVVEKIVNKLKNDVRVKLRRRGGVIGISGGIDSSVTFALAARAFGSKDVVGIMLPEKDSSGDSKMLAQELAKSVGVANILEENITGALEGFKCYERRDEAVKRVFPEYDPATYKMKIGVNQRGLNTNLPPVFSVTIIDENKQEFTKLLPANEYLQIVASSNFKQRCRMSMLYYHAERLHYAVIGTPNKHEVEQGFFVKYGDGGADVLPIGNLYKSQVYELARYLNIPQEIIDRTPTTDTYTAEQTQEEFFYQLPFEKMDVLWYGFENGYTPEEVAPTMNMTVKDVDLIFKNFNRKQITTDYLRMSPIKDY